MEGTKNERSVVIIASYIIGFVTSFLLLNDYSTVENSSAVIYTTENVRDLSLSSSSDNIKNDVVSLPDLSQKSFTSVSQNGDNVFYCDKLDPKDDFCYGYVYQKTTNTVHEVVIDNSPLSITEENLSLVSWVADKLTIGNITSENLSEPWLLIDDSVPIDLQ